MKNIFSILLLLGAIFFYQGCKNDDDKKDKLSETDKALIKELLQETSGEIILPASKDFVDQAQALQINLVEHNVWNPERIEELRYRFNNLYLAWQKIEPFDFGPSEDLSLNAFCNTFPCNTTTIKSIIEAENIPDFEDIENVQVQGLPTMEYLLFGYFEQDEQLIETLDEMGFYKNYLIMLTLRITELGTLYESEWLTYKFEFDQKIGNEVGSSLSLLFNAFNQTFERRCRDGKVGIPAGIRTENQVQLDHTEGLYSKRSISLLLASVETYRQLFLGPNGRGFSHYLNHLNSTKDGEPLAEIIDHQFEIILDRAAQLPNDLRSQLEADKFPVVDLFNDMQRMVIFVKVDMSAELGILIAYEDNDGDS